MSIVFFALGFVICVVAFKKDGRAWSPFLIFSGVWTFITLLYQLHLSRFQGDLSDGTYVVLSVALLSYAVAYLISEFVFKKRMEKISPRLSPRSSSTPINFKVIVRAFILWVAVELIEVIVAGGVPLVWLFLKNGKNYFDFGIPSLHGLMNALGLVIILLSVYHIFEKKEHRAQLVGIIAFILLFYLLLITRQVIVSALIEIVVVALIKRPKKTRAVIIPLGLVCIILFGIVGNIRTGYDEFQRVAQMRAQLPPALVGFNWVYMYLTMTLANINSLVASNLSSFGGGALVSFVPSALVHLFSLTSPEGLSSYLVTEAFNVSGYFIRFYLGWGLGGVVAISVVYGLLGGLVFQWEDMAKSEESCLMLAVVIQITTLSFFDNMLLYLPSSFQIVIILFLCLMKKGFFSRKAATDE